MYVVLIRDCDSADEYPLSLQAHLIPVFIYLKRLRMQQSLFRGLSSGPSALVAFLVGVRLTFSFALHLIRISGIAVNVTLAFCMGKDLEGIMDSSFGQPMAQIFFNSFGQKGTLAMWSFIIIAQYMMGSSMVRFSVPSWKRVAVGLTIISDACGLTPIFRLVRLKSPPPSDTL